jgi:hypothetical protein
LRKVAVLARENEKVVDKDTHNGSLGALTTLKRQVLGTVRIIESGIAVDICNSGCGDVFTLKGILNAGIKV